MELVVLIGHYNFFIRVLCALGVEVEPEYNHHLERFAPSDSERGWR
ncbi:hypothetical protein ABZ863_27785 [Saccharomonospora sp. NPDC046836]